MRSKNLHILVVPSWYPSENRPVAGSFFREQAQALKRAGYQVGVIAPILRSPRLIKVGFSSVQRGLSFEDDQGVPTFRYHRWAWLPRIPYGESYLWIDAARRLFQQYRASYGLPDVIHAHSSLYAGVFAARIKYRYHIPYVITEHSTIFARNMLSPWKLSLVKQAVQPSDARIAVSPELGKLLARIQPDDKPWRWVPNVVDSCFRPADVPRPSHNRFRFLNIGFIKEHKGQRELLEAFAQAFSGDNEVELRIGGDGPELGKLRTHAAELRISAQVSFLGQLSREEVVKEMQSTDVFVLSSHYETFGVVLIEALACGKPVIATKCGGPEVIVDKGNGLLVPPRDPVSLAHAMIEMKNNITCYDPISIRSSSLARFGEAAVIQQLSNIYDEVIR